MGSATSVIRGSEAADSGPVGKQHVWSVAIELFLLVFCFVFAIYTAQAEPARRTIPQPAQQTKGPQDGSPQDNIAPLTEPVPPSANPGEAVAIL